LRSATGVAHGASEESRRASVPDLLQGGSEPAMFPEYLLNRTFGRSDACVTPEKTKARAALIAVGCIEGEPMVAGLDSVAQMPLAICKGTD